jgi:hypothetical protein
VIRGSEAHSAFLKTWIETQQTTWKVWWAIANDGENEEGEMEEWLATGTLVTTTNPDGTTHGLRNDRRIAGERQSEIAQCGVSENAGVVSGHLE